MDVIWTNGANMMANSSIILANIFDKWMFLFFWFASFCATDDTQSRIDSVSQTKDFREVETTYRLFYER